MRGYRIGIDVGGTFTDVIAVNGGEIISIKVPTTPTKPAVGVIEALQHLMGKMHVRRVSSIVHSTTLLGNALFGQSGIELPRTALITTKGFRDIIEIGRQRRPELYNLFFSRPKPPVPRELRLEVDERIDYQGRIIKPVNARSVSQVIEAVKRSNVEAIAICLINSYVNPAHERKIKETISQRFPKICISSSAEVAPEYREYERTSTTVLNATLSLIISDYLSELKSRLDSLGVDGQISLMQSNGGLVPYNDAFAKPVALVESGPAAGVIAAAYYSRVLGLKHVVSFDMGGTTAKVGSIRGRRPMEVDEFEVGGKIHLGRLVKGSGYPIRIPALDVVECSAGGGTIAWVDEGGSLRIGPKSAGAAPGPACYGAGGESPTITDVNLVSGRLNSKELAGGSVKLHPNLAFQSVRDRLASILGIEVVEAAVSVIRLANSIMARILRIATTERGHDPAEATMMAFGGAGPMHCCALADELGIARIIVPVLPGLFSAIGLMASDVVYYYTKPVMMLASQIPAEWLEEGFRVLEEQGRRAIETHGIKDCHFLRGADVRYLGQSYELRIDAPSKIDRAGLERVVTSFHTRHREVYGYSEPSEEIEVVNIRVKAVGAVSKPNMREIRRGRKEPNREAVISKRDVYFEEADDFEECPIYARERLQASNVIHGPAVIEEYDATTLVYPGWMAQVDEIGNLVLETAN